MKRKEFIVRLYSLGCLKKTANSLLFLQRGVTLTICKGSASLDQNCRRSYPETNMLKNLIQGL